MRWGEFEAAAPRLAAGARARLAETRLALIGTLRADGSPRISPIEPYFTADDLLLGAMTRSLKVRDLERDPRCVLHTPVVDPDAGEAEFKLYGRALEAAARDAPPHAWWLAQPPAAARVYTLEIEAAAGIAWQLARGEMTVTRWSAAAGLSEETRSYP